MLVWRRRRFRNRIGLRQPIKAVHDCRMTLKTPIQTGETSDSQNNRKDHEDEAPSGETSQSPFRRRRFNPPVHVRGFLLRNPGFPWRALAFGEGWQPVS